MRKLYFLPLLLFLFLWLPKTQAQEYHQMLGDTVVWYETDIFEGISTEIYTTMGKDTIINFNKYSEIVHVSPYSDFIESFIFIREDTIAKKIYAKPYYTMYVDSEAVIYDFNLVAGDSVFVNGITENQIFPIAWYHVDSVGLFNTLIDTRKVFYLSGNVFGEEYKSVWVEGIGSLAGLTGNSIEVSYDFINCYYRNDNLIYETDWAVYYNDCYIIVGISDMKNAIEYKLSPNPFRDKININKTDNQLITIKIFDVYGHQLMQYKKNQNSFELDLNDLMSGVYIIQFIDNQNNCVTKKIIKTNYL